MNPLHILMPCFCKLVLCPNVCVKWGRDSSVGIATPYGLDYPGIESRWGRDFPQLSRPGSCGPPSLLYNGYQLSFPGVKQPVRGVDHSLPRSAEVKESWAIPLLLWAIMEVLEWTFWVCKVAVLCSSNPWQGDWLCVIWRQNMDVLICGVRCEAQNGGCCMWLVLLRFTFVHPGKELLFDMSQMVTVNLNSCFQYWCIRL
jgi:hypothetical protein